MRKLIRYRRRLALTDYKRRVALLKSGCPRVVIRKSNRGIIAQVLEYDEKGDRVLASANSKELKGYGWPPHRNLPTAYLTGALLAKKAKALALKPMVLDTGLYKPIKSSVIFAAAKGCIDAGLKVSFSASVDESRIRGDHIASYAKLLAENPERLKRQFSSYAKGSVDAAGLPSMFDAAKGKIISA